MAERAPLGQIDFSGGINANASPYHIGANQVLRARNLLLDEEGALKTRDGAKVIDLAPSGTARILALGEFQPDAAGAALQRLAILRTTVGENKLYNRNSNPWTLIGTFGSPYDTPSIVPFLNKAMIAAGYNSAWITDGVVMNQVGAALVGAKYLAVHKDAMWAWNTQQVTTTNDGPSALRQSATEDFNTWPNNQQLFVARDDGQVGTGLATFTVAETGISPDDFLVAFKNYSTYLVVGAFNTAVNPIVVPAITQAKTDKGCVASRSIQFISTPVFQGILRLTHRGFSLFDGLNDALIDTPVRPYLFGKDEIVPIAWSVADRSVSFVTAQPALYVCACPLDTVYSTMRVFVLDLVQQGWMICDFPRPFSAMHLELNPIVSPFPLPLAGNAGGPEVMSLFSGEQNDDLFNPIPWSVTPRRFGAPLQPAYFDKVLLSLFNVQAQQQVTSTCVVGPTFFAQSKTQTVRLTRGASFGLNPLFPSTLIPDVDVPFAIGLTGETLLSQFNGSGTVRLRAIQVQATPKPVSRPARV